MDEQRTLTRAIFDRVADTYDQVDVDFFGPIAQGLVDELAPARGERAVDVGCGRGAALFRLAAAVGARGAVTGVDLSPAMVAATRQLATASGLNQVDVLVMDAQEPDLEADAFDIVAASLVLFFLPEPVEALRRWRSCLVPGGRLGVSTFGSTDPGWLHVDEVFEPWLPPRLRDARTTGATGPFGSDAGVEGLFRSAGLEQVRTTGLVLPVVFTDVDHWYRFSRSTGQLAMWNAVPAGRRDEVRAEAGRRLRQLADDDGSVRFDTPIRYTIGARPGGPA